MTEAELLRANTEELLREQKEVLSHAGAVVRQASRELGRVTTEEVYPRVARGTRVAAQATRDKIVDDVIPAVASVIGSTLSVIDSARDKRLSQLGKLAGASKSVSKAAPRSTSGAGKYIAIGVGVAALLGIGYVVWQTFRADDELWVSEDE